jgi:hypothetical protein
MRGHRTIGLLAILGAPLTLVLKPSTGGQGPMGLAHHLQRRCDIRCESNCFKENGHGYHTRR